MQGDVVATKTAKTPSGDHFLIDVRQSTDPPSDTVIDAGADTDALKALRTGDHISATGRQVDVGDKPLLVADQLANNDLPIEIQSPFRPIQGRVVDSKMVELDDGPHQFVMVDSDGVQSVVDLGTASQPPARFQPDDVVTFYGAPVDLRDHPVFLAHGYRLNNHPMVIWRGLGKYVDTSPDAPTYPITVDVMLGSKPLDQDATIETIELSGALYEPTRVGNHFRLDDVPVGNYLLIVKGYSATHKPIIGQKEIVLTGAGSKKVSLTMDYE